MIKIVMANSDVVKWRSDEYTDYKYDGKCFIVIKDDEYVGICNMDFVISIIAKD